MQKTPELARLLEGRGHLYRFLSRLYLTEVDEALWKALSGMTFPETAEDPRMAEGWQRFAKVVASDLGPDPVETLAVDYARIFLSAGVSEGAAYPIESVYTSPEHLVMQDAWEEVCRVYHDSGFEKDPAVDVHEDQLGLELSFLAHLNDRILAMVDAEGNDPDCDAAYLDALRTSRKFLDEHPLRWVADFCRDVRKCPGTDFYPAVSLLTEGFLAMDAALLKDLIAEAVAKKDGEKAKA